MIDEEHHLAHYGTKRHSGRYPWGSGEEENQQNKSFLDIVAEQRRSGLTEAQVADIHGLTTTQLRARRSIAIAEKRQDRIHQAQKLQEKGLSNVAIGKQMGEPESTVRSLLAPGAMDKAFAKHATANMLKAQVAEKGMIDVGVGVERHLAIPRSRLDTSIAILREEGYALHNVHIPQVNIPGKFTTTKVLGPPGTTLAEMNRNRANIKHITDYSDDYGRSYFQTKPPLSISSKRLQVKYGDEGGKEADGMIYVRPGVDDLKIGNKRYGQVRIMIDGTHYVKGMAVYKDDLPPGKDLVFNTKKTSDTPLKSKDPKADTILKPKTDDPDLPFGSVIRQMHDGKGNLTSAINLVGSPTKEGSGEEGSWDTWSKNLSAQMLSKQNPKLVKQQLGVTSERRLREFNEIKSLTNPTVRRELLNKFADSTDAAAVHLKAASIPRQATKVIIPISSLKPNEIYAPTFRDGERVVLIRYPHGGTFEIPEVTVNNRNREGRKIIGTGKDSVNHDAIGIHHKVAERLSGADFDGDTVLVIPNSNKGVEHRPGLEGLKNFDPMSYKISKDSTIPKISVTRKNREMGNVSNLITDMTLRGASDEQLSRAIRHSMVVIDSEKHNLNWKLSEKDHGILALKEEYQGGKKRGASTLISRKRSPLYLPKRELRKPRDGGPIDPKTGRKVYVNTGAMVPSRKVVRDPVTGRKKKVLTGEMELRKERHDKLAVIDDAHDPRLSSGTKIEAIYADHSNKLKALANEARKEAHFTKSEPYSPSAKKVYAKEVASLDAQLNVALKNAPRERQAQLQASSQVSLKRRDNPDMERDEEKKIRQLALNEARLRTGAKKTQIKVSQSEWNAIQAGAISKDKLEKILENSDPDSIKALAMPKNTPKLSASKLARAQQMIDSGYTQAEVADAFGIGLTTLKLGLNG